jgi:hypothetical protein
MTAHRFFLKFFFLYIILQRSFFFYSAVNFYDGERLSFFEFELPDNMAAPWQYMLQALSYFFHPYLVPLGIKLNK